MTVCYCHAISKYAAMADEWYMFDNSTSNYKLIAKNISGKVEFRNFELYEKITQHG